MGLWAISSKQENIWVKWVNAVYIKNQEWWTSVPSSNCSWYWKKICAVKEKLKSVGSRSNWARVVHLGLLKPMML